MKLQQQARHLLMQEAGKIIKDADVFSESTMLERDEIDPEMLEPVKIDTLPEQLIVNTFTSGEYTVYMIQPVNDELVLVTGMLKDVGEVLWVRMEG